MQAALAKVQTALNKVFGGLNITWPVVIIGAIIAGVYTGIMAMMPGVQDTSLTDICVTFESWVLFAAIIVTNTKTPLESALKCFVFFLISQPLVYLVQVPFVGWSIMGYYRNWIIWTIATLPLGFMGWYIKKNNIVAVIVMAAGSIFLAFHAAGFLHEAITNPPWHILSFIFCVCLIFAMIFGCFEAGTLRKVSVGIAVAALLFCGWYAFNPRVDVTFGLVSYDDTIEVTADSQVTSSNEDVATAAVEQISEDIYTAAIHFINYGTTEITLTDPDGTTHRYTATCEKDPETTYMITVEPID